MVVCGVCVLEVGFIRSNVTLIAFYLLVSFCKAWIPYVVYYLGENLFCWTPFSIWSLYWLALC